MKRLLISAVGTLALSALPLMSATAQITQVVFGFSGLGNSTSLVLNGTFEVQAQGRGWYDSHGDTNNGDATNNYAAGYCGSIDCTPANTDYRNWFRFDLSNFTPLATTAVLRLFNPNDGFRNDVGSSLGYYLYHVQNHYWGFGVYDSLQYYTDLGSGDVFGSTVVTALQNGTMIEIELNTAALNSINTERQLGMWAVGGAITPPITNIPEPSTYALMLTGLIGVGFVRSRRKRRE